MNRLNIFLYPRDKLSPSEVFVQVANPIYDVVFKYLLDDQKVAKLLLSALLGNEVEDLQFRPTEIRTELIKPSVLIMRMDFAATLRLEDGSRKLVLIEIQKAQTPGDIMRFRRYLGNQYASPQNAYQDENGRPQALPIITIYFLGESLERIDAPVVRVTRTYRDAATESHPEERDTFIESLTHHPTEAERREDRAESAQPIAGARPRGPLGPSHDCILVQIPMLKQKRRNELEQLLSIFDQSRASGDKHLMDISEDEVPEKYRDVLRRLTRAVAEKQVRDTMDVEDELLSWMLSQERERERMAQVVEEQAKALEDERLRNEAQAKAMEEQAKALEEQARQIEELKRRLAQG